MPTPPIAMAHGANFEYGSVLSGTLVGAGANGLDQINATGRGLVLVIDITAFAGTSVTFTLQGKDPASGKYYTIIASAALAAVATTVLRVYPGLTAAANLVVSDVLPRTFRLISAGTFNNTTFTAGAVGVL
jgi:hypothetical protein